MTGAVFRRLGTRVMRHPSFSLGYIPSNITTRTCQVIRKIDIGNFFNIHRRSLASYNCLCNSGSFLQVSPRIPLQYNQFGEMKIHTAVRDLDEDGLRKLLEDGANPNRRTTRTSLVRGDETPLHIAVKTPEDDPMLEQRNRIIKMLLDHGACPSEHNHYGLTVVSEACCWRNIGALELFFDNGLFFSPDRDGKTPLHHAASAFFLEGIRMIVERGYPLGAKDDAGLTPLHMAIIRQICHPMHGSSFVVVQELLSLGANPNEKDNEGRTALYWAINRGQFLCVWALLNHPKTDRTSIVLGKKPVDYFIQRFIEDNGFFFRGEEIENAIKEFLILFQS